MGLQEKIRSDLKNSMKAKDKERTGAIRIIIGEFQRQLTKELEDDQVIAVIKKLVKSEKELLASSGQQSSEYLKVLEGYLPRMATEDELRAWIVDNIDFTIYKNKMQAMRPIMTHFGSTADGNVVKKILENLE